MEVTTTIVNENDKKIKITVCNGYFLDRTVLQSLTVVEQKDIAPKVLECLNDYISNNEKAVSKAKRLNEAVYQLLSNKEFRTSLKTEWDSRIKTKNSERKRKLSQKEEFKVKNTVICEARDFTVGNVGLWNEYDFWNVGKELNCVVAEQHKEFIQPLLKDNEEPTPCWLEESLKDLKTNKGK